MFSALKAVSSSQWQWPDLLADMIALRSTETQGTHFLLLPGSLTGFINTSDIWDELESQEKGGGEGTVSLQLCRLRQWLVQEELMHYSTPILASFLSRLL